MGDPGVRAADVVAEVGGAEPAGALDGAVVDASDVAVVEGDDGALVGPALATSLGPDGLQAAVATETATTARRVTTPAPRLTSSTVASRR